MARPHWRLQSPFSATNYRRKLSPFSATRQFVAVPGERRKGDYCRQYGRGLKWLQCFCTIHIKLLSIYFPQCVKSITVITYNNSSGGRLPEKPHCLMNTDRPYTYVWMYQRWCRRQWRRCCCCWCWWWYLCACAMQVFCTTWAQRWIRSCTASCHTAIVEHFTTPSAHPDLLPATPPGVEVIQAATTAVRKVETAQYVVISRPTCAAPRCLGHSPTLGALERLMSEISDWLQMARDLVMPKAALPCCETRLTKRRCYFDESVGKFVLFLITRHMFKVQTNTESVQCLSRK